MPPSTAPALKGALAAAAKEDIKIIAYDRLILDSPNVDYYATFDNYLVGKIQGEYIETALGLKDGKGPFNMEAFGGSPDDNNAFYFNRGAMDVLQPYLDNGQLVCVSGQLDMEQIAIQGWKSEGAQSRMDNLLTANYSDKKLDLVLSPNDSLAQGIVASLRAAGYGTARQTLPGAHRPGLRRYQCQNADRRRTVHVHLQGHPYPCRPGCQDDHGPS